MSIVDKLIDYQKNRDASAFGSGQQINPENLIVIVTELLSWLKLERKREIWQEQGKRRKISQWNLISIINGAKTW